MLRHCKLETAADRDCTCSERYEATVVNKKPPKTGFSEGLRRHHQRVGNSCQTNQESSFREGNCID